MSIDFILLQLAGPHDIERWANRPVYKDNSAGEVTKADTINYRTFKPERDGLFCERIFGSITQGECACGKTKLKKQESGRYIETEPCPACQVQPTDTNVRRYRMGCIRLKKPIAHMWYFRNTPNSLAILLNIKVSAIDELVHFDAYAPATPGTLNYCLPAGSRWYNREWQALHAYFASGSQATFDFSYTSQNWKSQIKAPIGYVETLSPDEEIPSSSDKTTHRHNPWMDTWDSPPPYSYINLQSVPYATDEDIPAPWNSVGYYCPPEMRTIENCGAEALEFLLKSLDLRYIQPLLYRRLKQRTQEQLQKDTTVSEFNKTFEISAKVKKLAKRLQLIRVLDQKNLRPDWMIMSILPVLPPDLRPMVQMDGGRFAVSDLNDLYRRLIYRKLRFEKFYNQFDVDFLPDLLIRHDLSLIQSAADAIIDNGRIEKPVQRANKQVLKSLTSIIEGKQGRFRQNLLGKRVDYSGRSVIVVGPKLRLHQCGLPREMALELFHPFVIRMLLERSIVKSIRGAKNLIKKQADIVWTVLERVIVGHPVLLNRAPTLHRLGIQAFEPILLSGRAIQLHPLVCPAFNADFDGDQMAVHIPLSVQAQAECRLLMLATHNWLSPATGEPSIVPSQDMILGFYYLTATKPQMRFPRNKGIVPVNSFHIFSNFKRAMQAYWLGLIHLHQSVWVSWTGALETISPLTSPISIHLTDSGESVCLYDAYLIRNRFINTFFTKSESTRTALAQIEVEFQSLTQFRLVEDVDNFHDSTLCLGFSNEKQYLMRYVRTTTGRILLNNLLYENLLL